MKWLRLLPLLALMGCAKFPDVRPGASVRLVFTLTVDGTIRTGQGAGGTGVPYIYMVALRFSDQENPTTDGPVPVVAPPWGNGFVAGQATHFVWWDPTASNEYLIYRFNNETTLTEWFPIGVPIVSDPVNTGSNRIRFEINLAQLYPTETERNALRSVQVNFLTMDRIPQTGTQKEWDALGNSLDIGSLNDAITIPLRQSAIYDNQRSGDLEPTDDQPNPELDISDWRVEVRLQ